MDVGQDHETKDANRPVAVDDCLPEANDWAASRNDRPVAPVATHVLPVGAAHAASGAWSTLEALTAPCGPEAQPPARRLRDDTSSVPTSPSLPSSMEATYTALDMVRSERGTLPVDMRQTERGAVPVAPLTAYNYYFRFERDRLLQLHSLAYPRDANAAPSAKTTHAWILAHSMDVQTKLLHDQWSRTTVLQHVSSRGRIPFRTLTHHIAQSWRMLPQPVKHVFREISARDLDRYEHERKRGGTHGIGP